MPLYVYEATTKGREQELFEFLQGPNDPPYTHHPETGEPIQRVIMGRFGVLSSGPSSGGEPGPSSCGPGCGCC